MTIVQREAPVDESASRTASRYPSPLGEISEAVEEAALTTGDTVSTVTA